MRTQTAVLWYVASLARACGGSAPPKPASAPTLHSIDTTSCAEDSHTCPTNSSGSRGASFIQAKRPEALGLVQPQENAGTSTIQYQPEAWNSVLDIAKSHNCYQYALDDVDLDGEKHCGDALKKGESFKKCRNWFHLPGYFWQMKAHKRVPMTHYPSTSQNCAGVLERVKRDNQGVAAWQNARGSQLEHDDDCPQQHHYMAALVVDPALMSFHFYRRDRACSDGTIGGNKGICWSHKPGSLNVTHLDGSGTELFDLRTADRRHGKFLYKDICGYFCLPGNTDKSTHSAFFQLHPKIRR